MRSLAITVENLANQKEAVKQERRLSFDNQPYATAIVDKWPQLAFTNWTNSHSLIGSFEDLNAASLEDVHKFFTTYYAPNNAVLTIVGDIQVAEAKKLIKAYFGDIPPQPQPKRPDTSEPTEHAGAKSDTYKDPLAKVPAVVVGYAGPKRGTTDFYALSMLDAVLTGGDSSRLEQEMVKGKKSLIQYTGDLGWPFASAEDYKEAGDLAYFLIYKPNFSANEIVDQFQGVIGSIQKDGLTDAQLARTKTFLVASKLNRLQTAVGRAKQLAEFEVLDQRPEEINTELDHYAAVTAAQVQEAAKKYLSPEKRIVLSIQPDSTPKSTSATSTKGGL
jgi:predicted Zn-dependent peptidase